jgi:hypothetical protein
MSSLSPFIVLNKDLSLCLKLWDALRALSLKLPSFEILEPNGSVSMLMSRSVFLKGLSGREGLERSNIEGWDFEICGLSLVVVCSPITLFIGVLVLRSDIRDEPRPDLRKLIDLGALSLSLLGLLS